MDIGLCNKPLGIWIWYERLVYRRFSTRNVCDVLATGELSSFVLSQDWVMSRNTLSQNDAIVRNTPPHAVPEPVQKHIAEYSAAETQLSGSSSGARFQTRNKTVRGI